ncbi:MAG TPA: hypothetical protein VFE97_02090 [Methylomirabilota bacterium]|jgi:hypothetical protein|nr:hypothetical protein [Methylomirabilota bacterium]
MAFRDTAKDFVDKLPKHRDNIFYNADGFVGPPDPQGIHRGTRNITDDVMLVQHFLKIVAANPTKFKKPFRPPAKFPTMKVDGIYGETTAAWIGAFQNHLHNIGRPVLRDGVVDRVRNGLQLSPNGFVWTMVMLNVAMGQVTGDELWDEWWKEPSVPGMLRDKVRNPATFL